MYEIVCEESFQSDYGRPYQSEHVVRSMLSLIDATEIVAEYNKTCKSNEYYCYREMKEAK